MIPFETGYLTIALAECNLCCYFRADPGNIRHPAVMLNVVMRFVPVSRMGWRRELYEINGIGNGCVFETARV